MPALMQLGQKRAPQRYQHGNQHLLSCNWGKKGHQRDTNSKLQQRRTWRWQPGHLALLLGENGEAIPPLWVCFPSMQLLNCKWFGDWDRLSVDVGIPAADPQSPVAGERQACPLRSAAAERSSQGLSKSLPIQDHSAPRVQQGSRLPALKPGVSTGSHLEALRLIA